MWKWWMTNYSQINEERQLDKINPELRSRKISGFWSLTVVYPLGQQIWWMFTLVLLRSYFEDNGRIEE